MLQRGSQSMREAGLSGSSYSLCSETGNDMDTPADVIQIVQQGRCCRDTSSILVYSPPLPASPALPPLFAAAPADTQ